MRRGPRDVLSKMLTCQGTTTPFRNYIDIQENTVDHQTYLRMQAITLLRLSRTCFDLDTSSRLREIADDMQRQAADDNGDIPPPYMRRDNGQSGDMDRE